MELRELNRNPSVNKERIRKLEREIGDMHGSRDRLYGLYRSEVSRVLNDEQRGRYNSFVDTERKRMGRPSGPGIASSGPMSPRSGPMMRADPMRTRRGPNLNPVGPPMRSAGPPMPPAGPSSLPPGGPKRHGR
jgi:hypothetical protein